MRTTAVLPAGQVVRAPELTDAEAIFDLLAACNTAVIGFADYTLDEVVDDLSEPGFDRRTDAWLVTTSAGRPIGYGTTLGRGDHKLLDVDVVAADPAVAAWLFERCLQRARELGRDGGHGEITVDTSVYRADEGQRELVAGHGFVLSTTFHRMRIDHSDAVEAPEPPVGAVLRRGAPDDATRRTAHAVQNESFRDHFGHVARSYDDWYRARESNSAFDWSQLTLLEVDGRAVAVRECNDQFVEDEDCGYIARLGVLAEQRGRGLARFLLRDAFAIDAAAGRTGTILHVDTNNVTPALGLYLSVGMRPTLVIDVWRRTLSTG